MTVLVAIPYWRCAEWVGQAVECALAQEGVDVRVLVGNDGDEPPSLPADPRAVLVNFPDNLGAPLTQQAMLLGSPFGWYAPHGADDWAEPAYLARLLARGTPANGSGAIWHDLPGGGRDLVRDTAHAEFGVFEAELLRAVGGYGIDRRCGQDTLLFEQILPRVAPVAWMTEPLYHKRIRPGSLTAAPETGFGSPYRDEVVAHNREVAQHLSRIGFDDLAAIRRHRDAIAPPALREALAARAAMVREALS